MSKVLVTGVLLVLLVNLRAAGPQLSINSTGASASVSYSGLLRSSPSVYGPFTHLWGAMNPFPVSSPATNQFWRALFGGPRTFSAGFLLSAAVQADGTLWRWGQTTNRPVLLNAGTNWTAVECGASYLLALKLDGTLWAQGGNSSGELGIGSWADTNQITEIGGYWRSISAGQRHSAGIKTNGTLWAWGENDYGKLGIGSSIATNRPVQVGTDNDWVGVACGEYHTFGLKADGSVWACGSNQRLVLGLDNEMSETNRPIRVGGANDWALVTSGDANAVALRADGSLWTWGMLDIYYIGDGGENSSTPLRVGTENHWVDVACGAHHVLLIDRQGRLQGWGDKYHAQLGPVDSERLPLPISQQTNWIAVSGGDIHTLAMQRDGSLWALGNNNYGQLGLGTWGLNTGTNQPTQVGGAQSPFHARRY